MKTELATLGGLSVFYLSENRLEDAEKINHKILEISSKESTAWHDLAEVYRRRVDYQKAE